MFKIYFGTVVDVVDSDKIWRVRVTVVGKTDEIPINQLPWYYPFFGLNYLPVNGDRVPLMIFNDNFATGFYNRKIDLSSSELEGTEYENYLEIYKRLGVQLTYKESTGIELINQNAKLQIETDRASMYVEDNQITMDRSRIDLGTDGPAAPLGDKTVIALNKNNQQDQDAYNEIIKIFLAIQSACAGNPMLTGVGAAIASTVPQANSKILPVFPQNKSYNDAIQSLKVFIE